MAAEDLVRAVATLTHSSAPKALLCVSARTPLNVLTTTAVIKLMSQKLMMMTPTIQYRAEKKKSESIALYMAGAHVLTASVTRVDVLTRSNNDDLDEGVEKVVKAFRVAFGVLITSLEVSTIRGAALTRQI